MSYENPSVRHEVNVSQRSDLASFIRLFLAFCLIIVVGFAALSLTLRFGARYIPFSFEARLINPAIRHLQSQPQKESQVKALKQLQTLAETLAEHLGAPADMPVNIHLIEATSPNALTTLGGHIIITQEILDSVRSENGLAMIIAHELAHIKNRDVLVTLGTGVVFSLASAMIAGQDAGHLISGTGALTQLKYSRQQETAADEQALGALRSYYGHTFGADEFFQEIANKHKDREILPEFLYTHPAINKRIERINESQRTEDMPVTLTPLPQEILDIQSPQP